MRFKQSQIFAQILEQFVINPRQYTYGMQKITSRSVQVNSGWLPRWLAVLEDWSLRLQ